MERIIIGLCGGSGSGKTTLAKRIVEALGENAVLINMDSFYRDRQDLTYEERCLINYDAPEAFEGDMVVDCLKKLKAGDKATIPTYDFTKHLRAPEWVTVESAPVIIIDGILLFAFPEIVDLLDIKIFVDTDADVRVVRRILRDVHERGRSVESVAEQYLATVKPMHELYIEPYKRIADIIVPEGGYNEVACDIILHAILKKLGIR